MLTSASSSSDTTGHARLRRLPAIYGELRGCASTEELFARAAEAPLRECGFARAMVLSVTGRGLSAVDSGALEDAASDQLRRRALASAVPLVRGTEEAELVRRGDLAQRAHPATGRSVLASALDLENHAFAPVVADAKTLALVVADRPEPELDEGERLWLDLFAAMLAVALVDVVMRERVAEISAELRHFTASALALVREATEGSISLPSNRGAGPSLPRIGLGTDPGELASLFSERETRVAELLVEGKSNRQIAEELVVSPETVKTHVGRILRKLGAHNRAEAVGLFLRLRER
jgi:DNA-binding CsgD family transcriptional regulator